jgi:catechol 2,3-dioxygenase-like lactoylglutathione lyase family enzyme/GNAT superfamily N-acetyltransferase
MITGSTAVLAVADVMKSIAFYTDVLGFKQRWLWGNPPTFGCIGLGACELFLCEQPELATKVEGHMHCIFVERDLDALYEQHRAAGAPIVDPIANKPWGMREYAVRDPSGYHLRFGGPEKFERSAGALDALPPHVRIEIGLPELETCKSLFTSVGWNWREEPTRDSLANTLVGVVAIDTRDGQTVGMARATGDGKFYMLWDVVVRPSHQGQRIGEAMVRRVLDELRARGAPEGAFVGLFTPKPGFYEKIGFRKEVGMHMQL